MLLATCCESEQHPQRRGWQARVVELLGQGVRPCVPQQTVRLAEGVGMTFSFVPPGSFLMGSRVGGGRRDVSELVVHDADLALPDGGRTGGRQPTPVDQHRKPAAAFTRFRCRPGTRTF